MLLSQGLIFAPSVLCTSNSPRNPGDYLPDPERYRGLPYKVAEAHSLDAAEISCRRWIRGYSSLAERLRARKKQPERPATRKADKGK